MAPKWRLTTSITERFRSRKYVRYCVFCATHKTMAIEKAIMFVIFHIQDKDINKEMHAIFAPEKLRHAVLGLYEKQR